MHAYIIWYMIRYILSYNVLYDMIWATLLWAATASERARCFRWGLDYNFTNYTFRNTLELQKKPWISPLWQDFLNKTNQGFFWKYSWWNCIQIPRLMFRRPDHQGKSAYQGKPHIGPSETWDAGCWCAVPKAPACGCFSRPANPRISRYGAFLENSVTPIRTERSGPHPQQGYHALKAIGALTSLFA